MAEVHPLFSIFILILSALVVYWVLVGQRKRREMIEAGIKAEAKKGRTIKRTKESGLINK